MVKFFTVFLFILGSLFAETPVKKTVVTPDIKADIPHIMEAESLLVQKIKTFVSEEEYIKNKDFIKLIFSPEYEYYRQERVDVVKVVATLKENGLLNLFFEKPQELKLSFKTSGSPLFFVKIMGDTLRNIGYYRYVTAESNLDASEFTWTIVLNAEYATDPLILQEELAKSGCSIIDVVKIKAEEWKYSINMSEAHLNISSLVSGEEFMLKRSLYAHWLNIATIQNLSINSSFRDDWYPQISYYDQQLHLLEVLQKDKKTRNILLVMPKGAKYIKISDMYTLKNVKDNLILKPSGSR